MVQKTTELYRGKAKTVYNTTDDNLLVLHFRNDTSAFDGERIEQLGVVGHIGQLAFGRDRIGHDIVTGDEQLASRWRNDAGQCPQRGGFARPVGPDKSQNGSTAHFEAEPGDGDQVAVDLVVVNDLNQRLRSRCTRFALSWWPPSVNSTPQVRRKLRRRFAVKNSRPCESRTHAGCLSGWR